MEKEVENLGHATFLNMGEGEAKARCEVHLEIIWLGECCCLYQKKKRMSGGSWCLASFGNVVF